MVLAPLLAELQRKAPRVDIAVRQLLPPRGGAPFERAWQPALDDLEARAIDIAIVPIGEIPARFADQVLYEEEFVIASRAGHAYAKAPSLKRFCEMRHVLVSLTGDAHGFVDIALAERGLKRRIELTVPNFMMALAIVAETDLIAALPKQLAATHAARFNVVSTKPPLPLRRDPIRAVTSKAALMDAGVAWLFGMLRDARQVGKSNGRRKI